MLPMRPSAATGFELTRELESADFEKEKIPAGARALQRISSRHKTAARLIAAGLQTSEVAQIVGYSPERVSQMTNSDPAFQNLVAEYEERITEATVDLARAMQEKLFIIAESAADEIVDRLEDDETRAKIPIAELRNLMGDALSRTVAPPKQTQPATVAPTKIIFNMGNKTLRDQTATTIEHQPEMKVIEDGRPAETAGEGEG